MTNEVPEIEQDEEVITIEANTDEAIKEGGNNDVQTDDAENVDPVDTISPLTPEIWPSVILLHLQSAHEGNATSEWFKQKVDEVCGKDFNIEHLWLPENEELTAQIISDYLDFELENIRRKSFSLNSDDISEAATSMLNISGIKMSVDQFNQLPNDDLLLKRISQVDELKDTYKVFDTGTQFYTLYISNNFNRLDIENNVRKVEDLHSTGLLETELLAKCYYNAAVLHEKKYDSKRAPTLQETKIHTHYMRDALSLTADPALIKICNDFLPTTIGNKKELVLEACNRAFSEHVDDPDKLYLAHMLYAKALAQSTPNLAKSGNQEEDYCDAINHYRDAFELCGSDVRRAKILRNMIKLQKNIDPEGALNTQMYLATSFLEGKTKVVELMKLSASTKNQKLKKVLLESAVNELVDTDGINVKERSLLLKNISSNLTPIYQKENDPNLEKLNQLVKKNTIDTVEPTKIEIHRISSKGNDHFR
jgi:hypothetical protein